LEAPRLEKIDGLCADQPMTIQRRGNTFYLRKRVPQRFKRVEDRDMVFLSLHTDSESIAKVKATKIWADMIEAWEAKLDGDDADAFQRMEAARNLAAKRGFRFLSADKVAKLPLEEVLERVEKSLRPSGKVDKLEAEALLGGARPPRLTVSRALDRYWTVAKVKTMGKTEDQIRRWRNPRKKAVANFIEAISDIPLDEITTRDLFKFREWWVEKMAEESLSANSANKDFIHLTSMIRDVARSEEIQIGFDTRGLAIPDKNAGTRPPFSVEWIRTKILADGALDGLNAEARAILRIMVNTGARPSEIAALQTKNIVLDAPVPHLNIDGASRQLKSRNSKRKIPLLGVSLEAAKEHPNGFPRYFDNPSLSDTVNKFLRENGLLETPDHSMYSLRHSFESRMLAADFPERIKQDLMGHRLGRERYGALDLEHVRGWLRKIAV
jgi:integrase